MSEFLQLRPLPAKRNYPLLLAGQFLSAFGDNALLGVILGQLTYLEKTGAISEVGLRTSNAVYTAMLFIPYVLLAPLAGFFNDRHAKTAWLVGGNALKLAGAAVCAGSLVAGDVCWAIGYFVVGIGSCIYGPAKYGILPEILPRERLVKANGTVEMLTLVAVLSGFIAGSKMSDAWHDRIGVSFATMIAVYAGALAFNFFMKKTPANPAVKIETSVREFFLHTGDLMRSPRLGRMLLGTALFWIAGTALKSNFQPWGLSVLNFKTLPEPNTSVSLLALWLIFGIIAGSVLAGALHKVGDLTKVPVYGFAMAGMFALLYSVEFFSFWHAPAFSFGGLVIIFPVVLLLVAAGAFAGLFLIPMNAALQAESDPAKMGKTIAVQNLFDNAGMCLAMLLVFVCAKIDVSASGLFLILASGTAGITGMLVFRKALR